jgi:hypothetical protein
MAARNMYIIEINIHEKELCVKLVIYKEYTRVCTRCDVETPSTVIVIKSRTLYGNMQVAETKQQEN